MTGFFFFLTGHVNYNISKKKKKKKKKKLAEHIAKKCIWYNSKKGFTTIVLNSSGEMHTLLFESKYSIVGFKCCVVSNCITTSYSHLTADSYSSLSPAPSFVCSLSLPPLFTPLKASLLFMLCRPLAFFIGLVVAVQVSQAPGAGSLLSLIFWSVSYRWTFQLFRPVGPVAVTRTTVVSVIRYNLKTSGS